MDLWEGKIMSKTSIAFTAALALALGMTACGNKTTSEKASDAGKSAGKAADDAGKAVGDATKATGEYLAQSKDAAVKAAQETLDGIEKKWQDLQAQAAPATDEAKADLQTAKDQMAQTLADAKAKLVEAKNAGADTWQQKVKPALDAALQKAQKLYEDTSAKFSKKPAE
jgi:hypothetical protein